MTKPMNPAADAAATQTAPRGNLLPLLVRQSWLGALVVSLALWVLAGAISGGMSLSFLAQNAVIAGFLAIAGVAQMIVIASRPGNFDLSLPHIITLSAYVMSSDALGAEFVLVKLGLALCVGAVAGVFNAFLIVRLRIPAIVATLANGYIIYSLIVAFQGALFSRVGGVLEDLLRYRFLGISGVLVVSIVTLVVVAIVLRRTVFGLQLHAMGQAWEAARLAGIRRDRMVYLTFILAGVLASWLGILLTTYQGGVTANLGSIYLLGSVAAVVVGGTRITGGITSVLGTALGALVLTLATTDLILLKIGIGGQYIIQGLLVIATVCLATTRRKARV